MEGSRHSSPATDRPLLTPTGAAQQRERPSSAEGPFAAVAEPTTPISHGQSQHGHVSFGYPDREADIADSGVRLNEKVESPTRSKPVDGEVASVDEARALDWIVPVHNGQSKEPRRTVGERLEVTLNVAKEEQLKYAARAKLASLGVNGAMFAQIVINALVTGLSALQNNRNAQIGVSALGAIGTIVASFLVRVRGTREPERSVTHSQNLEKYIRELQAFILDEGLSRDPKWDPEVKRFRVEFDKLQTAVHQSENGQPMA